MAGEDCCDDEDCEGEDGEEEVKIRRSVTDFERGFSGMADIMCSACAYSLVVSSSLTVISVSLPVTAQ